MKISTKTGDKGKTSLYGGNRVSKASGFIYVLGGLDELHSFLGWSRFGVGEERIEEIGELIERLQDDIYRMMGVIGYEMKVPPSVTEIEEADVFFLEELIEKYEEMVGKIDKFLRPGKNEASGRFHIVRSVCRRAERSMVYFNEESELKITEPIMKYMNRLSDLLFLMAYSFEV